MGNYTAIHRGINHAKTKFKLPLISKEQFEFLKYVDHDQPPLVNGVLIPIDEKQIIPEYADFKNGSLVSGFYPSPYHGINWKSTIYNRMPKGVIDYKRSLKDIEMVLKPEYRDLVKEEDFFKKNDMSQFNSLGTNPLENITGGVQFGNNAKNVANIPLIIAGIVIVFLLSVTGTFKNIFGGKRRK